MSFKIMQVEVSNECSLACAYCPHPSQARPKGDMSLETFRKCIDLVRRSDNPTVEGKQFLWLNHFGEPLLNPLLPEFIAHAVSRNVEVSFATNGVDYDKRLFPRSQWQELADAGLKSVMLSAHVMKPRKLLEQVEGIVAVNSLWTPNRESIHDWAGQVPIRNYDAVRPSTPCDYELHNMFAVLWDGMLASCCYDSEGLVGLSVDDVLDGGFSFQPVDLCETCSLGRGDVAWLSEQLGKYPAG